jgi:antitoxin CcdA
MRMKRPRVLEEVLRERVAQARAARWREENAAAIAEYNQRVEKKGVFSDRLRRF